MASAEDSSDLAHPLLLSTYQRGRVALRRFLRFRTRDESAADDLLQDLWLRAKKASGPQPVRDPAAFLQTIARNLATDWLRRRNRIAGIELPPDHADDVPCERPSAFDELASQEAVEFLARVIEELPPRRRQAFLLHRFEGLTMAEAAKRMGTSPETVERQVAQALSHCQARLIEFGWKP